MKVVYEEGQTPLDEETLAGLIPGLFKQSELDEFEAQNIAKARLWAPTSRRLKSDLLSATGIKLLHEKMFDETWLWAGQFRLTNFNIGVSRNNIQNELGRLFGDVDFWLQNKTYPLEEIAIRLHHRLVWIHPFPNGNGRFARLATDLFLKHNGLLPFTWGSVNLVKSGDARKKYIAALKKADRDLDFSDLLSFAKN
ncbi:mobile mystery protein B [Bdellovibrio sp. HCB274]|uniref:mobile mystery protein B n=1 Tax=Bdellovibrio sp. HCB274 TaxID=3394361 RepID=UPI0039B51F11